MQALQTRHLCAAAVAVGLAVPALAHAQTWEAERVEALMIASGRSELPGSPASPLPLIEERLNVAIDGQHATSTLVQVYRNQTAGQIEGRYALRPGTNSHVEGFAYWNGETKIVGEVFERQTARRVYENVTSRRRDPGLLEQDGEGAFSFRVFPIAPNEQKRIELRWTKWLDRRARTVRYHAPISRPNADIVISVAGAVKNVRSATHALHVEPFAGGVRLRSDGARGGAKELAIEWDVDEPAWTLSAYVQPAGGDADGWFALSLPAPDLPASAAAAKDVTIVVDRSGSMSGDPMAQARAAAADMIRRLDPNDRVNVIAFSDEVDPLFKTPRALDAETRARAIGFADRLHEGGGTDIALALQTAIASQDNTAKGRPRVIVFMTDGQSDVDKAIDAARTDTGDVRLFTLGFGKDVNRHLLSRLAATKRGRFVHVENTASIQAEVGRLAAQIAKPLLVDVAVEVDGVQAVKLYPRSMPDLFAQDELLVTGRMRGTGTAKFTIRGKLGGAPVAYTRSVEIAKAPSRPWVGRLWAQARVAHLLEEISLGAKQPELVEEVIDLAVAYNFVTPYTAFLAIPESELGAEASTVAAARARKKKLMADNPEVEALEGKGGKSDKSKKMAFAADAIDGDLAKPTKTADASDDGGADEEDESPARSTRRRGFAAAGGDSTRRGRGCAGCSSSSNGAGSGILAIALAAIVLRRRRRAS
jgi:Ca-activated chloride channel family protein